MDSESSRGIFEGLGFSACGITRFLDGDWTSLFADRTI
jgi:hypothetical protein